MPRNDRIVYPEVPYHVTQRGNRQQDIFLDDDDRQTYLRLLSHYGHREHLSVSGYCLMSNHLHLLVTPGFVESLPRAMRNVHTSYARYVNGKYGWAGHVFAGRYYSCPLDEQHFWAALRYVEKNPVRARMVRYAENWPWSSAPAHCGKAVDILLIPGPMKDWPPAKWKKWLRDDDPEQEHALQVATRAGRPCGSRRFVRKLERLLDKELTSKVRGRPKTQK